MLILSAADVRELVPMREAIRLMGDRFRRTLGGAGAVAPPHADPRR